MTENYLINKLNSEDSKKYIAGCIDSLASCLDLRKKSKIKIDIITRNFELARFLQDCMGFTCRPRKTAYEFHLSRSRITKIIKYCGKYISVKRDELMLPGNFEDGGVNYWAGYLDNRIKPYKSGAGGTLLLSCVDYGLSKKLDDLGVHYKSYHENMLTISRQESVLKFLNIFDGKLIDKRGLVEYGREIIQASVEERRSIHEKLDEIFLFKHHPDIKVLKGLTIEESVAAKKKRIKHEELEKLSQKELISSHKEEFKKVKSHDRKYNQLYSSFGVQINKEVLRQMNSFATKLNRILRRMQTAAREEFECKICGEVKNKEHFRFSKKTGRLEGFECKQCKSEISKKKYAEDENFRQNRKSQTKVWFKNLKQNDPERYRKLNSRDCREQSLRKVAKENNVNCSFSHRINQNGFDKHIQNEWKRLPIKIKNKYSLPNELSIDEISELRREGVIHFDHIIPISNIKQEIKSGNLSGKTIYPNHYLNIRPLPASENMNRSDNLDYLTEYLKNNEVAKIKEAVFC